MLIKSVAEIKVVKKEDCFKLLKKMILIRRFEQLVAKLFRKGKIRGTLHLSIGQEAVPTGVCFNLNKKDIVTASHRPHHIAIAKGLNVKYLLAELMGRKDGFCKGYSGSMHFFSKKDNFFGANGIVGANIAISAGMALAIKKKKEKNIVVTFFGDGATTEGIFHETMNMAALMKLPIIFVCENNLYAETTALQEHSSVTDLAAKVKFAYNIKSVRADGNDLIGIINTLKKVTDFVRRNKRPYFVEFLTYRTCGHSINDINQIYRKAEEIAAWKKKDPIQNFKNYLLDNKILTETDFKQIENDVRKELEKAVLLASKSKFPKLKDFVLENKQV